VYEGATVRIWCEKEKNVQWFKNGQDIVKNSRIIDNYRPGELLISLATLRDSGEYSCSGPRDSVNKTHYTASTLVVGGISHSYYT